MKCPHKNCHEDTEHVKAYPADPANNVPAWPGGLTCAHGHCFPNEDAPDPRALHREIYDVEPACLEMDGPMVPMENEQ